MQFIFGIQASYKIWQATWSDQESFAAGLQK